MTGRPRTYGERRNVAYRLDPDIVARLNGAADERDVSVNWLVTKAITCYLDNLPPLPETEQVAVKQGVPS